MKKVFSVFLLILLIYNNLDAQLQPENSLPEKYTDTHFIKKKTPFSIIRLTSATPDYIRKKCIRSAVKQLSPNLFVIRNNSPFLSFEEKKVISVYSVNDTWKLSPMAEKFAKKDASASYLFTIEITDRSFINDVINKHFPKTYISLGQKIISIVTTYDLIEKYFLEDDRVIYLDVTTSRPAVELGVAGFDLLGLRQA